MKTATQGLVAAALAAVLIRISWTGEYLRFVQPWMRWPLLAAGLALFAMAARPALGYAAGGGRVPRSAWLMLLPTMVVFAVAPPPLGAFVAERRPAQNPATLPPPRVLTANTDGRPLDLGVEEFTWGAAQTDDVMGLRNQVVRMDGFVSTDKTGNWYVSTLVIFCCAADAVVERVKVVGQPAEPRNEWVRVTGTWIEGTGTGSSNPAALQTSEVVRIPTPKDPYS